MRIECIETTGKNLEAGDLFSTAGSEYWDYIDLNGSIGERVYVRTNVPCTIANDSDVKIYKLIIHK
jgi:hypothetical protein